MAGIGLVALLPLLPVPLAAVDRTPTPTFIADGASQRVIRDGATVVALPFPTPTDTTAMNWQADDDLRWNLAGGFFIGPHCATRNCSGHAHVGALPRATGSLLLAVGHGATPTITPADRAAAQGDLAYWRADDVLLCPTPHEAQLRAAVAALLGQPGRQVDDCRVWALAAPRR